jgi:hypothetical protein
MGFTASGQKRDYAGPKPALDLGSEGGFRFRPRFPGPTMELEAFYCSLFGLATSDWSVKLMPLEQVGGRAHEAQFGFVWNGGAAA